MGFFLLLWYNFVNYILLFIYYYLYIIIYMLNNDYCLIKWANKNDNDKAYVKTKRKND